MAHLVETGQLTLDDVQEAERLIRPPKGGEAMRRWTGPVLDHLWQSTWCAAGWRCSLPLRPSRGAPSHHDWSRGFRQVSGALGRARRAGGR